MYQHFKMFPLFSCSRLFLLVISWGIHLPPLTTQSSVAIAALLGSVSPVHHSLLAMFVQPLLPFLFFLGFRSVGLLLWGPLIRLCQSPSLMLCGSFFRSLGFLRLQALLLLPLRCFTLRCLLLSLLSASFSVVGQLALLAAPLVCVASLFAVSTVVLLV